MRNSNRKKSVLLNATRLFVLALCFTMVFAFALTNETVNGINDRIASADAISGRLYAKDVYRSGITPDDYALSAFRTGFESIMRKGSAYKSEWNIGTVEFFDFDYKITDITYNSEKGKILSGDGSSEDYKDLLQITKRKDASDGLGGGLFSAPLDGNDSLSMVFNLALPEYLFNLISTNEEYKLTFDAQVDVSKGERIGTLSWQRACAKIATSSTPLSAINADHNSQTGATAGGGKKGEYGYKYNDTSQGSWKNSTISFTGLTLNRATPNIYVCIGVGESSGDCTVAFRGLKLTNVKLVRVNTADSATVTRVDGAAPVVESQYKDAVQDTFYPYRKDTTSSSDWPVWYESIEKKLSSHVDSVVNGEGKMYSYTNILKNGENGSAQYYKSSKITYIDAYNYLPGVYAEVEDFNNGIDGTNVQTMDNMLADDININYAAGIKRVTVGDKYIDMDAESPIEAAVFNLYDIAVGQGIGKNIYVEGEIVGWAYVHKINRAKISVSTYIYKNARISTEVADYGDYNNRTTIDYKGIDNIAPDSNVNTGTSIVGSDFLKSSADALAWLRQSKLSADASIKINEDDTSAGFSPYVWFYTVDKAPNLDLLNASTIMSFNSFADIKAAGIKPIALGEISSFDYDFVEGKAKSYGSKSYDQGNPSSMTGAVTGHGYYRFNFYIFDLAGNKGGVQSFYAKVDYDTPTYNLDLSYINKKNENVTISAEQNGAWATGKTTLKLTLTGGGFSGYTLVFEDAGAVHTLVVDGEGEYEGANYVGKLVKYHSTNAAAAQADGNSIVIPIESNLQKTTVAVTYEVVDGKSVFTFVIDTNVNVAWLTTFTAYAGQYDSAEVVEQQDVAVSYFNTDWKGGVKVLIDSTAPQNPLLSDSVDALDTYLNSLGGNYTALPDRRVWYTDAYRGYTVDLAFSDDIVNSDYASGITVFYGMKVVKNLAELQALGLLDIESKYADFKATDDLHAYFDRLNTTNGSALDGDQTALNLDLITSKEAGMRVVYTWAVDQAGNVSGLGVYYVLADANNYTVSSTVKANSALGATANIAQTDSEGNPATQFKRGQTVNFNIGIEDGYVPFKFVKNDKTSTVLLENYLQNKRFALANEDFAGFVTFSETDVSNVQYVMDDPNSLDNLANTVFELSHRKVVTYTVTNTSVAYTAKETVVPLSFSDVKSQAAFVYRFVDDLGNELYLKEDGTTTTLAEEAKLGADGKPMYFVPVKPGKYKVNIFVPKDNDSYVTDDFAMDESGNQTFTAIAYSIIKGRATISAKASTSAYGSKIMLEYDVEGIAKEDMASEGINVSLALNIQGFDPNKVYSIGSYTIVNNVNYDAVENYIVTYLSNEHVITARQITVHTWENSKKYGDSDPEFVFGVGANQFAYTTASIETVLNEIFGAGYEQTGVETLDGENFYLYKAGDRISRQTGETVGEYEFNADSALFDVDSNYVITIQNNQHFNITKRNVVIDASGQFSVLPFGSTPDPSAIVPSYTIAAEDLHLQDEIAAIVSGKLSLAADGTDISGSVANYSQAIKYAVLLATAQNVNINVTLGENAEYIIYVTEQNAVVVKVKDGVKFEFVYGIQWNNATTITFDATKFDVTGKNAGEYDNITWTATISAGETLVNAGSYTVKFENAKLVKDGAELADKVFVESTTAVVNPATVVVNPTSAATQKTYGEPESVFGIGFGIASVNNVTSGSYAGKTFDEIKYLIDGTFARARYAKSGDLRWLGSRYDDATDSTGVVALPSADGDYYGYAVNSAFKSSDRNFVVVAQFDAAVRFVVNPKALTLHTKDIVGVSKVYDGTTAVNYGSTKVYDFASMLAIASDDVYLTVSAQYNKVGSPSNIESASIILKSLALAGDKAHNYVIASVVNDAIGAQVNGLDANTTYDFADVAQIEIVSVNGTSELIYIINGIIGVVKSDITIEKQYDNTQDLTINHVSIASTQNEQGIGTKMLAGALENKKAQIIAIESGKFSGVNVSSNYVVNVTLFFVFGDETDKIKIETDGIYDQPDVEVTKDVINGVKGIKVKLTNMSASITKRVLDENSFESISAVDRDYNATDIVNMNYTFKQGALVEGDTPASVGLRLMGVSASSNAGNHNVTVADLSASNDSEHTFVSDGNYTVNVDALNTYYSTKNVKVTIARAKLMPNVTFVAKEYDAKTSVAVTKNAGNDFTTAQFAVNLNEELKHFSYDASKVSYVLSTNGVPDANVTANEMHNVLVSGMEVKVEAGYESLLANYQIYGSRYNALEGYNTVGSVISGVIADYEIIEAAKVTKKVISLVQQDFDIKDKVYDGTTSADITIKLQEGRVVLGHEKHLEVEVSGTFARKQVGTNINVKIDNVALKAIDDIGASIIGNYELRRYNGTTSANIIERPVVIGADLGSRVYNGTPNVSKGNIKYTLDGIMPEEVDNYNVQTRNNAYYFDKNVEVVRDASGAVIYDAYGNSTVLDKRGTAYNPTLTNKTEKYINYVLVYGVNNIISGKKVLAYDDADGRHFGAPASGAAVTTYYYALETVQKYVLVSDTAKLDAAKAETALVGYFVTDKLQAAYFVTNDYAGEISGTTETPVPYVEAKGRILQRSVYIAANGIKKVDGSTAYEKEYDGTTKFYGTLQGATPAETDAFFYEAGSVANVIGTDKVTIKDVSAQFDRAGTDALYVVFSVSGIEGEDAYNYTIASDKPSTVNLTAKIVKRSVTAALEDGETAYGTSLANVGGKVNYTLGGYALTLDGNSFYMNFKQYLVAVGFLADETATVAAADEAFVKQLYGNTYNFLDNQFVKAGDAEVGEYIRLGGTKNDTISNLPKPKAVFSATKPGSGEVATSYMLTNGSAKNFAFAPKYTGNSPDGTSSKLTVVKKDLYVVTVGISYTKTYGGADPTVELRYLDSLGKDGIVSGETWTSVFKIGSVDYRPVVKLAIYNSKTGTITDADKYALISRRPAGDTTSKALGENEYYVFYLAAPDGVEYANIIANYNVILGGQNIKANAAVNADGNPVVDADGKAVLNFVYDFASVSMQAKASTLEITLPALKGISVASTENNYVYTVGKDGKGINRVYDVLQGETDKDEVTYVKVVDGVEVESEAVNAGVHEGVIKVKRFVKVDEGDTNGYFIVWTSGETQVKITIEKASVALKANKMSEYYNGKEHVYVTSGINNKITSDVALSDKDVTVGYELFDGKDYSKVTKVVNAGTYRVTISLSDEFLKLNPNYKPESVQTTLTVIRAIVNVTFNINEGEYDKTSETQNGATVTKISTTYDKERIYDVAYTVKMDDRCNDAAIAIGNADTKLEWNKNIESAGRYAFSVVLDSEGKLAANYNFVGASGILELTATELDAGGNQVSFTGGGVVANKLVVKEIKSSSVLGSDMSYLEAIEQYVAILSKQAGLKNDAQVAAVLRLGFYLDNQLVNSVGNEATVTVNLPSQVKNMKGIAVYTVTEQGGLKKLTDYKVDNGKLTYKTDYVSGIVFVDVTPQSIAPWKVATIVCVVLAVAIIVTVCVVGTIIRKRQLKNS